MAIEDSDSPALDTLVTRLQELAEEAAQRLKDSPAVAQIEAKFDALVDDVQAAVEALEEAREEPQE